MRADERLSSSHIEKSVDYVESSVAAPGSPQTRGASAHPSAAGAAPRGWKVKALVRVEWGGVSPAADRVTAGELSSELLGIYIRPPSRTSRNGNEASAQRGEVIYFRINLFNE